MRRIERLVIEDWIASDKKGERYFPHEFMYRLIRSGKLKEHYDVDPANSWLLAACEKNLPIFVPGWEDSTLGNVFTARVIEGKIKSPHTVKSGIETMMCLAEWYRANAPKTSVGFFQIGGGIAGDFPICVVPMIHQDLRRDDVPLWGYFCQISDSTTSYGSYSGAVPNEKITWGKLSAETPKFVIESDATICAPLMFAKILGW
jgi:deoxyhypusine synthase